MNNEQIIYAFAHCETWLQDFAHSNSLPAHELTERVAKLLHSQTRGSLLGSDNPMPTLRRKGTKRSPTARSVEVVGGPHSKASRKYRLSAKARAAIGRAQRKRWRLQKKAQRENAAK